MRERERVGGVRYAEAECGGRVWRWRAAVACGERLCGRKEIFVRGAVVLLYPA